MFTDALKLSNKCNCHIENKQLPFVEEALTKIGLIIVPLRIESVTSQSKLFPLKKVSKLCHPGPGKSVESIDYYKKLTTHKFWGNDFFVPLNYDEWLRQRYKNPYILPDEEKRMPAHSGGQVKL